MMGSAFDLIELSRQLKQERLFINCEREQLRLLNTDVSKTAEKLYCLSWITRKQKANLGDLVRAAAEVPPVTCCQKANSLENVKFIDGYKTLTYHESKIGEVLKTLRNDPMLVATVLIEAEREGAKHLQQIAHVIMCGVYGNTVMQEDEFLVLQVLKALIELQVAVSDNPRKLLRKTSSAFGVFFRLFIEGLFSSRLFLTAALHKPVMQLLMEDEWFYDIDPQRALHRFPPNERIRRFGTPETPEYETKTKRYRDMTAQKLVTIAERFITSIKSNMYCFPQSLSWLVSQLYHIVNAQGRVSTAEARSLCADLVLALFICPAICDPEPLGITSDAPLSYIARHNLMQVAQMLQVLAISSSDEIDTRQIDLYGRFSPNCMGFLLNGLLQSDLRQLPAVPHNSGDHSQMIQRTAMYMTLSELRNLLRTLRIVVDSPNNDSKDSGKSDDNRTNEVNSDVTRGIQALHALLECVPNDVKLQGMQQKNKVTPNASPNSTPPGTPSSKRKRDKGARTRLRVGGIESEAGNTEDVILVTLGVINECPGMESEQKILEQETRQRKARYNSLVPGEDDPISEDQILANEKRTRFSLSHDQDSIATSDNLEAISEAASSHSVGSDIENDNLSDMVSANVSGRGTPSISGRDTPLSQVTCETDSVSGAADQEVGPSRDVARLPVTVHKNNREDVTDKFQKFEIERDEIKSTVSDTWSTDVLASDSEPPEQNARERLDEIAEDESIMVRQNLLGVNMSESEALETASDAWSTDVLASDTSELQIERLRELEQEEVSSVGSRSQLQEERADPAEDTPQPSSPRSSCSGDGRGHLSDLVAGQSGARGGGTESDDVDSNMGGDAISDALLSLQRPASHPRLASSDNRFDPFFRERDGRRKRSTKREAIPIPRSTGSTGSGSPSLDTPPSDGVNPAPMSNLANTSPRQSPASAAMSNQASSKQQMGFSHSSQGAFRHVTGNGAGDAAKAKSKPIEEWVEGTKAAVSKKVRTPRAVDSSPDDLTGQFSTGLKLTEQQNTHIDAKRLSSVVDVFDPLALPSLEPAVSQSTNQSANQLDLSIFESTSENDGQNKSDGHSEKGCKSGNFNDQGARPKIVLNQTMGTPPKIQLNEGKGARPKIVLNQTMGTPPKIQLNEGKGDARGGASPASGRSVGQSVRFESNGAEHVVLNGSSVEATPISAESSPSKYENSEKNGDKKKASSGGSIFKSFKDRLSKGSFQVNMSPHRSGKSRKSLKDKSGEERVGVLIDFDLTGSPGDAGEGARSDLLESSDDILAKYRRPAAASSPRKPPHDVTDNMAAASPVTSSNATTMATNAAEIEEPPQPPAYDPANLENCKAFLDAKKKLRLVLSTADFQAIPLSSVAGSPGGMLTGGGALLHTNGAYMGAGNAAGNAGGNSSGNNPTGSGCEKRENELVSFLRAQLAEAINLQDKDLIARLHETIRCLAVFNNYETKRLLKSIKEEHRSRSPYTSYLIRCRQGLLGTQAHLERLLNRVQRDKTIVNKYFLSVNVRLFLEERESQLVKFIQDFQKLSLADEKTEFVEDFLQMMHEEMDSDPVWQCAREEQVEEAKVYIERNLMSHIYTHAMYPNGDGDIDRDRILFDHMKKLGEVITPSHKDLRIPAMYHYECPWPAAQNEIYMINAYKTPKDKLQCVLRCSSTIMNLLSLANEKSVPAADDFMPVLIYVLIKANPPSLLSTLQYVNSFYLKRLHGEEQYWWMQFQAAVAFIHNMDYDR